MSNGYILYRGPSRLNGKPIVVIATGFSRKSKNAKTGNLVQTHILSDEEKPTDAIISGKDDAVCGDCPHRRKSCYVNIGLGQNTVYAAYQKGSYPTLNDFEIFRGRIVRFGTYGDPAAVPMSVWNQVLNRITHWTGYTHQWKNPLNNEYQFCMASVETPELALTAQSLGWRTFRVKLPEESKLASEFVCPASEEAGRRKTCETCKACRGSYAGKPGVPSVVINVHGIKWKKNNYRKTLLSLQIA